MGRIWILVDADALNDIIVPTTNIDRLLPDGTKRPEELVNKSQTFINFSNLNNRIKSKIKK